VPQPPPVPQPPRTASGWQPVSGAPTSPSPVGGYPAVPPPNMPVSPSPVSGFPAVPPPNMPVSPSPMSSPYTLPSTASSLSRATYAPTATTSTGGRRTGLIAGVVGGGVLVVILVVALVVWAAGNSGGGGGGPSPSPNPLAGGASPACGYKLAYLGVLTGDNNGDGVMIRDAARLAVEQYNDKHSNCRVTLAEYDTVRDEAKSAALAQQISDDSKILGVIGPVYRFETLSAGPILERGGIPMITPSASDNELSRKGWKTFHRLLGTDADQAVAGARYLRSVLKVSKTYIVSDDSEFGATAGPEVRRTLGDTVIGEVSIKRSEKDYSAAVKKVTDSGADSVYYAGWFDSGGLLVKQLRTALPKIPVVSGDKIFTASFVDAAGGTAEGVVMTCPCMPADQAAQNFASNFKKKYSQQASYYGPEAFDATNIFLAGLNAGKSTRQDMLAYVNAYEGRGVARTIKFTVNGDLDVANLQIWAYKVQNGNVVSDQVVPSG
jgi:branched-chain amino acid transport system substrate-binding protein